MRSTLPTFNEVWQQQFAERLSAQAATFSAKSTFVLACSGGVDSLLLLYVMAATYPTRLRCIYIDHQLQNASSAWGKTVAAHAQHLHIACEIQKVDVEPTGNVEQQARVARYDAFARALKVHEVLLMAHHQQDQAETLLLRLFKGSGVSGLAAMQTVVERNGMTIWRPFLDLSRQQIEQWAASCHIDAIQDPMNAELQYDRVWCRQQLWPLLQARFPHMQSGIIRSSSLLQDAACILAEVCASDLTHCLDAHPENGLDLTRLVQLSEPRQRQLLSTWMQGDATYRPALHIVEALQHSVIHAKADAQALLHWNGIQFRRFQHRIFRLDAAAQAHYSKTIAVEQLFVMQKDALFQVASTPDHFWQWQQHATQVGLSEALFGKELLLKQRVGGEMVHLQGRVGRWPLKKAIQAAQILPWIRHTIQILYADNVILGIFTPTGFWLAQSDYCQTAGWLPVLQHHPNTLTHFEQDHDSTQL